MVKKSIFLALICVFILSLVTAIYFYIQYQQSQKYLKNPTLVEKEKTDKVVAEVGKLMDLPKNEEPTLGDVADTTKLKDQPFFAKAKNGDKILIYTQKREIILYRESTNKIINVAPISINLPTATQEKATPSLTPSPAAIKTTVTVPPPIPTVTLTAPSPTAVPTP
jgi:hypothetical protein